MITRVGVQGTMETVPEVECNHDTIYLRENIIWVEAVMEDDQVITPEHWEYNETEMTVAEYADYVKEQAHLVNLDTMEALTQVYEDALNQEELGLSTMEAITLNYESILALEERILSIEGGTT